MDSMVSILPKTSALRVVAERAEMDYRAWKIKKGQIQSRGNLMYKSAAKESEHCSTA